jgi:hypothetical protein
VTAPARDPFEWLADRLARTEGCRMLLATAVSATATRVTVDLLGSRVEVPRLAGTAPTAGQTVLCLRQGPMIIAVAATAG